jgi:hypothetical protein
LSRADVAPPVVIDADKQPDRIVVWLEGIQEIRMQRAGDLLIVRKTALHPEDLQRVNAILIGKQNSDQERLRISDEITSVVVRCIHLVTRKTIM